MPPLSYTRLQAARWISYRGSPIIYRERKKGKLISGTPGAWQESPYNEGKEVIVGYYHILANDFNDAVEIAKGNPEFSFTAIARVEVRPIKTKEVTTGYIYPKGN